MPKDLLTKAQRDYVMERLNKITNAKLPNPPVFDMWNPKRENLPPVLQKLDAEMEALNEKQKKARIALQEQHRKQLADLDVVHAKATKALDAKIFAAKAELRKPYLALRDRINDEHERLREQLYFTGYESIIKALEQFEKTKFE